MKSRNRRLLWTIFLVLLVAAALFAGIFYRAGRDVLRRVRDTSAPEATIRLDRVRLSLHHGLWFAFSVHGSSEWSHGVWYMIPWGKVHLMK